MKIFTIGFTKTTAEKFFSRLRRVPVRTVVDVRLNNVSQLSGFAKKKDLEFFARELVGAKYRHLPELAPTKEMLDRYKKKGGSWSEYEQQFLDLMSKRHIERGLEPQDLDGACLLCSEHVPHNCHRRLVAEYLRDRWGNVEIIHL